MVLSTAVNYQTATVGSAAAELGVGEETAHVAALVHPARTDNTVAEAGAAPKRKAAAAGPVPIPNHAYRPSAAAAEGTSESAGVSAHNDTEPVESRSVLVWVECASEIHLLSWAAQTPVSESSPRRLYAPAARRRGVPAVRDHFPGSGEVTQKARAVSLPS